MDRDERIIGKLRADGNEIPKSINSLSRFIFIKWKFGRIRVDAALTRARSPEETFSRARKLARYSLAAPESAL
jgi:hypothetical protein